MYVLVDCPTGHKVINTTGGTAAFSHDSQECQICDKGEECTESICTACEPCRAGYYKSTAGTDACVECPVDTYRRPRQQARSRTVCSVRNSRLPSVTTRRPRDVRVSAIWRFTSSSTTRGLATSHSSVSSALKVPCVLTGGSVLCGTPTRTARLTAPTEAASSGSGRFVRMAGTS